MNTIPVCMFPTKVIMIDDDIALLKDLELYLDDSRFTYQFYNSPHQALTYLNEGYNPDSFEKRLVCQPDEDKWQHAKLDVNIYDLLKEIYNPRRFESISTIIVDYAMPGINGLELCEKITDPSIQKILLTGEGDEQLAIQAFNKGIIHRYIRKQDPDILNILNQSLFETQRAYFTKVSQLMLDVATFSTKKNCLNDPVFIDFFDKIIKEKNITEYYLFETTGNFLLLDDNLPEGEAAPQTLLNDLKSYKKMICFHDKNTITIPAGSQWEKYAYPLQTLEGGFETYHIACAPNMLDIETNKVCTFQDFIKGYQKDSAAVSK
jgi:CheY-like chemotaxis protein